MVRRSYARVAISVPSAVALLAGGFQVDRFCDTLEEIVFQAVLPNPPKRAMNKKHNATRDNKAFAGGAEVKTELTSEPERTETHRIDTKAVRLVISRLHVDWVIRSLEERDYGIDLQIEFFKVDDPTGNTAYVQVKGTSVDEAMEKFSFPVKTLLYAQGFIAPFFLFYVSTTAGIIKFVWLQKYIEMQLHVDSPLWRTQKEVTIHFPEENSLNGVDGVKKFIRIVEIQSEQPIALEFLKTNHMLQRFLPEAIDKDLAGDQQIQFCASEAKKLSTLTDFLPTAGELGLDGLLPIFTSDDLKQVSHRLQQVFASDYLQQKGAFISLPSDQAVVKESLLELKRIESFYLRRSSTDKSIAAADAIKTLNLKKPY